MIKRTLASALGLLALCTAALAQVNVVPQIGVTTAYLDKQTYSAVFIGLAPASTTTDLICISGSTTKNIILKQIKISGSAGTTLSLPVTLLHRISLDTSGTAASTTANPANTISKRNSANGAATAVLIGYTANPTIGDSSPTYVDSVQLAVSLTTMATVSIPAVFDWSLNNVGLVQPPVIPKNTTEQYCINLNGTSLASGLLTGSITWTEE
jgi:hypothetical protein